MDSSENLAAKVDPNFAPFEQAICSSDEEYRLAVAILKAPSSDEAKLAYADWLDLRQDARGEYLRLCVDLHQGKATADWSEREQKLRAKISKAWSDTLGLSVWFQAKRGKWAPYADGLPGVVRPYVVISNVPTPDATIPVGASHFCGYPDLPADFKWPTEPKNPKIRYHFLTQLNLSELAHSPACRWLPRDGWLVIFTDVPGNVVDYAKVVYLPANSILRRNKSLQLEIDSSGATSNVFPPDRLHFSERAVLAQDDWRWIEDPTTGKDMDHMVLDKNQGSDLQKELTALESYLQPTRKIEAASLFPCEPRGNYMYRSEPGEDDKTLLMQFDGWCSGHKAVPGIGLRYKYLRDRQFENAEYVSDN